MGPTYLGKGMCLSPLEVRNLDKKLKEINKQVKDVLEMTKNGKPRNLFKVKNFLSFVLLLKN